MGVVANHRPWPTTGRGRPRRILTRGLEMAKSLRGAKAASAGDRAWTVNSLSARRGSFPLVKKTRSPKKTFGTSEKTCFAVVFFWKIFSKNQLFLRSMRHLLGNTASWPSPAGLRIPHNAQSPQLCEYAQSPQRSEYYYQSPPFPHRFLHGGAARARARGPRRRRGPSSSILSCCHNSPHNWPT